ncbi:YceI family protein [Ekhidna sp.]|uniref:YceI family protein n=1 Tax=Ekhidna sp. TaxID=2608089 RepID=UPI0032978ACC
MNTIKILVIAMFSLLSCNLVKAQNVLIDKQGVAHFFSEAPLEDIEATNDQAVGAIDLNKGTVAVSMLIKNFHFEKSLMEEHFNENYLESEKYPKASFKGKIVNFESLDFSKSGILTAKAEGELEIHGVSQPVESEVTFEILENEIKAKTIFKVALEDHKIKIPKLVIKNIAEIVDVDVSFNFEKK